MQPASIDTQLAEPRLEQAGSEGSNLLNPTNISFLHFYRELDLRKRCLRSVGPAIIIQTIDKLLKELRQPLSEYGREPPKGDRLL